VNTKLGIYVKKSAETLPEQTQKNFEKSGKRTVLKPKIIKNEFSKWSKYGKKFLFSTFISHLS